MVERRRRGILVILIAIIVSAVAAYGTISQKDSGDARKSSQSNSSHLASVALAKLSVKGRAPKTGYSRQQFSDGWGVIGNCDIRNLILRRDLTDVKIDIETNCKVISGNLNDPYTGKTIVFKRGAGTSTKVQIDHVVAVSDAWQKGAQQLIAERRYGFYNDPLNLLAVSGSANQTKSDGDAATWLPSNKDYRCRYIARQIAVKLKYALWVTFAEQAAMKRVLHLCPNQVLPVVGN